MHQIRYRAHIILGLVWTVALGRVPGTPDTIGAQWRSSPGADITADDFNTGSLDTQLWNVVDPQGDGTVSLVGAGTPDAHLLLSVPTGTLHDAWTQQHRTSGDAARQRRRLRSRGQVRVASRHSSTRVRVCWLSKIRRTTSASMSSTAAVRCVSSARRSATARQRFA